MPSSHMLTEKNIADALSRVTWIDPGHRLANIAPGDYGRERAVWMDSLSPKTLIDRLSQVGLPASIADALARDAALFLQDDRLSHPPGAAVIPTASFRQDGNDQALAQVLLRLFDEGPAAGALPVMELPGLKSLWNTWPLIFLVRLEGAWSVYRKRGIPETTWKDTWQDLALWMEEFKKQNGDYGLREVNWLAHHARGEIFRLGRLQYLMDRWDGPAVKEGALSLSPGDETWSIHIPAGGGLTPEACGESHRQALAFIAKHFPERSTCPFTCVSWIMSPDLEACGESAANPVAFQKKFHRFSLPGATAHQMWERVFGGRPAPGVVPVLQSRLQKSIHALATGVFPEPGPRVPGDPFATGAGVIPAGENPWA